MTTPTIGELERRIADLEARGEEWDEEIGMADEAEPYEDHEFDPSTHTFSCGGYAHEGELAANVGGLEAFRDDDGDYWLTSPNIRRGLQKGYLLGRNPDNLRLLADKIEEAER